MRSGGGGRVCRDALQTARGFTAYSRLVRSLFHRQRARLLAGVSQVYTRSSLSVPYVTALFQVARDLGVHIYVDRARWRNLECLGLSPRDTELLTTQVMGLVEGGGRRECGGGEGGSHFVAVSIYGVQGTGMSFRGIFVVLCG